MGAPTFPSRGTSRHGNDLTDAERHLWQRIGNGAGDDKCLACTGLRLAVGVCGHRSGIHTTRQAGVASCEGDLVGSADLTSPRAGFRFRTRLEHRRTQHGEPQWSLPEFVDASWSSRLGQHKTQSSVQMPQPKLPECRISLSACRWASSLSIRSQRPAQSGGAHKRAAEAQEPGGFPS
jgi:hypothetical protein